LIFKSSPKAGITDTVLNLIDATAQVAGAPKEATMLTGTVASATPSAFGKAVASNLGRALWNTGAGLYGLVRGRGTKDFSGLSRQEEMIYKGQEGAPLQGYDLIGRAIATAFSKQSAVARFSDITGPAAEQGERGLPVALGNMIADEWFSIHQEPAGVGGAFKLIGDYLWQGALGHGGIKSGLVAADQWLEDSFEGLEETLFE
jgi:hypothetical protein